MAKRSQRRRVQREKHQSGCMWGLISMLDFRRTRSNQKLLPDRRSRSGRHSGIGHSKSKTEWSDLEDNPQRSLDDPETKKTVLNSAIVKILMEEDMVNEQGTEQKISKCTLDPKQSLPGLEGQRKKDRKRNRKSYSKSLDFEIGDLKDVEFKCSCNAKIEQDSADNVMNIMEKLCHHIYETTANSARHGHNNMEVHQKLDLEHSAIEEKLCAAVRELLKRQINCHEYLLENEEIQGSKELKNVLQILNSDDVSILELLRDRNSVLVNYIQSFQGSCLEGNLMSNNSNLSESNENNRKHRNFFRMKTKSQEAKSTRGDEYSQAYNKIIILKPGLLEVPKPETHAGLSQSPQLESISGKTRAEKMHNHYFLHDLKRKLKNVLGKDHTGAAAVGRVKRFSNGGENMRKSSTNKDHFYIEKVARPSYGGKRVEKIPKTRNEVDSETSSNSEQRLSNIYIEAKKHLAEIINDSNGRSNSLRSKHQHTLGKIISDGEVHISPLLSPRREQQERMATMQMRFSAGVGHQEADSTTCMEGSKNNPPNIPSCSIEAKSSDIFSAELKKLDMDQDVLYYLLSDDEVKNTAATAERMEFEDTPKAFSLATEKDCAIVDFCSIPSGSSSIENEQHQHLSNTDGFAECLEKDPQDMEHPFSSSPPYSSVLNCVNDLEIAIDKPEQPSPVSVLERIYAEDDTSPTRTIGQADEAMMQPLHIKIQEDDLQAIDHDGYTRNCLEDIEQILDYVNVLLEGCGLDRDALYLKSHDSEELPEQSLVNDVDFFADNVSERKLIFDCTNEVLLEVCESNVSRCPLVSFAKPGIVTVSNTKEVIREVCKGVYWHLLPLPRPRTLEQIVRKDMSKTGSWMELSLETEIIGFEMGDAILDKLMEDTMLSFMKESSNSNYPIGLNE